MSSGKHIHLEESARSPQNVMGLDNLPINDREYPRSEAEFHKRFSDEEACRKYLIELRWPKGFVCPRCNHAGGYLLKNREKWECAACKYHCSIRAGTVMQASKKPLVMWFAAMYYMIEAKKGFSALGLQRRLALPSYQTAWSWFQKLRDYLKPESGQILGKVEVDEFFLGGKAQGIVGRGSPKKIAVACVVECRGRACGKVRLKLIKDLASKTLIDFVTQNVQKGSTVNTDANKSYNRLASLGYMHNKVTTEDPEEVSKHLGRIFRVQKLVKDIMHGMHMGAISPWRMQRYLDEYMFRFERRNAPNRFLLFQDLIGLATKGACRTCRVIAADREAESAGFAKMAGRPRGRRLAVRARTWWHNILPTTPWPCPGEIGG